MKAHLNKYSNYDSADFLGDENFIRSVKNNGADSSALWNDLQVEFPEKKEELFHARAIIIALGSQELNTGEPSKEIIWQKIVTAANVKQRSLIIRTLYHSRRTAAAILVFIVAGSVIYYNYLHTSKVIQTTFENTATVHLPDESVITLNRNSSITYSRLWNITQSREVQLTGEAEFNVKHVAVAGVTKKADTFRVIVNNLRATVLGTRFNIRSRRGLITIVLAKGKIRIDFLKSNKKPVYLLPGEEFNYNPDNATEKKTAADITARYAWKNESLVLDGTPVKAIISMLEDDYGYNVVIKDPALLQRKISGTVPMRDINNLFFTLSRILDVNIEHKDKNLIIEPNK